MKMLTYKNSQNTIYDQTNLSDAKQQELQIVQDRIQEAQKGSSTMIDSLNMSGLGGFRGWLLNLIGYDYQASSYLGNINLNYVIRPLETLT